MSNGINYELDFEKRMGEMKDRQLLEFVARQTLEICGKVDAHGKSIVDLEAGDRKAASVAGGISATITSTIIGIISYFTNRS